MYSLDSVISVIDKNKLFCLFFKVDEMLDLPKEASLRFALVLVLYSLRRPEFVIYCYRSASPTLYLRSLLTNNKGQERGLQILKFKDPGRRERRPEIDVLTQDS